MAMRAHNAPNDDGRETRARVRSRGVDGAMCEGGDGARAARRVEGAASVTRVCDDASIVTRHPPSRRQCASRRADDARERSRDDARGTTRADAARGRRDGARAMGDGETVFETRAMNGDASTRARARAGDGVDVGFDVGAFVDDAYAETSRERTADGGGGWTATRSSGCVRGAAGTDAIPTVTYERWRGKGARGTMRVVVVHMHATGSRKEAVESRLRAWTRRAWVDAAVSFDAPGHGERAIEGRTYGEVLARAYAHDGTRAYGDRPYVIDGAVDCLRVCRALGARNVLLTGESLGGMYAACAASGWNPAWGFKIVACAPMIGFSSFAYGLANDAWLPRAMSLPAALWLRVSDGEREVPTLEDARMFYARVCPEMVAGERDRDALLRRIRANGVHFCAVNGADDARNPCEGVREAFSCLVPVPDGVARPQCVIVARKNAGHEITDDMRDVVDTFFANVLVDSREPARETFDDERWEVIADVAAFFPRASIQDKLKLWASEGVELASYLSEADREFLSNPEETTMTTEGVKNVERLIEATKSRLAEKYVSPNEISRDAKYVERARERALAVKAWEEHKTQESVKQEAKRVKEEAPLVEMEAKRLEEGKQRVREHTTKDLNAKMEQARRDEQERDRIERERIEAEEARKAKERERKEKGLAKARELLARKNSVKAELKSSATARIAAKKTTETESLLERLSRIKARRTEGER